MPVPVDCDYCGETFQQDAHKAKRNKRNYCDLDCRRAWQREQKQANIGTYNCDHCGESFTRPKYEARRSTNLFCSHECSREFLKNRVEVECEQCGKVFMRPISKTTNAHTFCSYDCSADWQNRRVELSCKVCGKRFTRKRGHVQPNNFCSRKCYHTWYVGENTGQWQGGKSFEPYPPGFNKRLKRKIRKRDNHTCQLCSIKCTETDRHHSCHHIDYCKDNLDHANLILLCRSCHQRTNHNRPVWNRVLQAYQRARGIY